MSVICATSAAVLLLAATASAQSPGDQVIVRFSQTAVKQESGNAALPHIATRARIFVIDRQGTEHRGRFLRFDQQALVMLVGADERRFDRDLITRIERPDSLKNGAVIGAIVGGALGALVASQQAEHVGHWMAALGLNIGLYTSLGTLLDAGIVKRRTVYDAGPTAPVQQGGSTGLAFRVRW